MPRCAASPATVHLPLIDKPDPLQETYGEDPVLLGTLGRAAVRGVQDHAMACVKHFAVNSIENTRFSGERRAA